MKWNIVTDSSCDLFPTEFKDIDTAVSSVPFIIRVGDKDFTDGETLDTEEMLNAMEASKEASQTACPSPQSWAEQFEKADISIAITISSNLSCSINGAIAAKDMVMSRHPEKKIAVIDSFSTGPEIVMCAEIIIELIKKGTEFEEIVSQAEAFFANTHIAFALSSFDNLVKNGRMNKALGFIAGKLGIWGIGIGSDEGTIVIKGKTRGQTKAIAMLLDDMKENGFDGGKAAISHCHNPAFAAKLESGIKEIWQNAEVSIMPTRGLCSFYAERGGVIISY